MGGPSVDQLLGRVESFSLPLATRQKAVEALKNEVTGFDAKCTKLENISDGMPAIVMACTSYKQVPVRGFSGSPSNPNSFIVANATRFGFQATGKALAEIMKGQVDIEKTVGASLHCYVGDQQYGYGLVCEPKVVAAEKPDRRDSHDYGPKW